MNYKYPPVYKYIILLILITTFLRYYKLITKDNFLLIAGIFTYMVFIFDYVLIDNHPSLLDDNEINQENKKTIFVKKSKKTKQPKKNKIKIIDEKSEDNIKNVSNVSLEDSLDDINNDDQFEQELKEFEKKDDNDSVSDNLTEEIQRELDELDFD